MKNINFQNNSDSPLKISIDNQQIFIDINKSKSIEIDKDTALIEVYEDDRNDNNALSFVLAFIISIPLVLMEAIEIEGIKNHIYLPTKAYLELECDNSIVIESWQRGHMMFALSHNKLPLSTSPIYTKETIDKAVKDYKREQIAAFTFFPLLITILFLVLIILSKKAICLILLIPVALIVFHIIKLKKSNDKYIDYLYKLCK
ncbi:MAG: hypothetical protein NC213_06045 [Acetobacter sp.]|nr:hypothetical protein [Bacteroides sp.]MCM1341287.1 hypothetical protein [Acetobacter sp.]MCM1433937.1 hypothetical protein [Clostridiales bacterium]